MYYFQFYTYFDRSSVLFSPLCIENAHIYVCVARIRTHHRNIHTRRQLSSFSIESRYSRKCKNENLSNISLSNNNNNNNKNLFYSQWVELMFCAHTISDSLSKHRFDRILKSYEFRCLSSWRIYVGEYQWITFFQSSSDINIAFRFVL